MGSQPFAAKAAEVRIEGVSKRFGETWAVREVTLRIGRGEFFTFLGPSGCGKTTLLRIVAGFAVPDAGEVCFDEERVTDLPPWRRNAGMVFQSYALWPHLSVQENVAFGLRERRLPAAEIRERVVAALALVGLAGMERRRPSQLSGGQQQRVALARTLVVEPRVLLLDEPLSNLDAKLREQMGHELTRIQRELGITTIYVTHDQEEALGLSGRIAVMDGGRIVQEGTPQEVYHRPARRFVAEFVGVSNVFPGTVREASPGRLVAEVPGIGLLEASPDHAALPQPGAPVLLSVRPEAMTLWGPEEKPAGKNAARGMVRASTFQGASVEYEVLLEGGRPVRVSTATPKGQRPFPPGATVTVCFDPADVILIPPEAR
ncbi:MAG: ABC transporter ATP-binding protein [candidate division NC10 bacterium]|nr:ABC transporter ATP-binding protein [candidate division NC10 bacterium]